MKLARLVPAAIFGAIVGLSACGTSPDASQVTDPVKKVDTTTTPQTPTFSKTAVVNSYLSQIDGAATATSQSGSAGGVPSASASFGGSSAAFDMSSAPPPPPNAAACTYDKDNIRWNCPAFTQANGVVVSSYFQFLDAANTPQADLDTATTVAIRRVTDKKGAVSSPLFTQNGPIPAVDTMDTHDDVILSGLKTPNARRLDGTGTQKVVIVPEGDPIVHINVTSTTANLTFFQDTTKRYPITGSITAIVASVRDGTPPSTSTTTQVTTFNGTTTATLVISFAAITGKRTCTYDMTNPTIPASCTGP